MTTSGSLFDDADGDWEQRTARIVEAMREMSLQDDPRAMVRAYHRRMRQFWPTHRWIMLSRRDLGPPRFRVTQFSDWFDRDVNPWKEKERLPVLEGEILSELLYGDQPRIIDDLRIA